MPLDPLSPTPISQREIQAFGVPAGFGHGALARMFGQIGTVERVSGYPGRHCHRIVMASREDAQLALARLDRHEFPCGAVLRLRMWAR